MVDYLTFGGVKSSDYDIYISGEGVFSAPKRDVEAVTIPGRDGDFIHDKGRYENITVTYPAFTHQGTYAQFISNIDAFRNAVASKTGYQKLTDTFHASEYRMACLTEGMEIDPILYNSGAKFDLVFNCKPQRFLTTGDTAVAVANNGTITNPTLFDAKPQLQVKGYGNITMNGYAMTVENATIGDYIMEGAKVGYYTDLNPEYLNAGDTFYYANVSYTIEAAITGKIASVSLSTPTITKSNADYTSVGASCSYKWQGFSTSLIYVTINISDPSYIYNNGSDGAVSASVTATIHLQGGGTLTRTFDFGTYYYHTLDSVDFTYQYNGGGYVSALKTNIGDLHGISSKSTLGNPTIIDCDIGEAYKVENDTPVSLNNAVSLGAELPVLSSGSNTITYDNTITSFKVVPRWWRI